MAPGFGAPKEANKNPHTQPYHTILLLRERDKTRPQIMVDFHSIAQGRNDLQVFTRNDDETTALFREALCSRAFNVHGLDDEKMWPMAIYRAKSTAAVQCVVQFCEQQKAETRPLLKLCVRSGGHCWHTSWLQGPESVLLDVGELNHVHCDEDARTLAVGPGATGAHVLQSLPSTLFVPVGHYPSVALGGFVLGGGFGIGFTRYSMTSMLVDSVQVVLASGDIVDTRQPDETNQYDTVKQAVMDLVRGSHCAFPAVLTEIRFRDLPDRPRGVLSGSLVYSLQHYRSAIETGLNIQFHGDYDAAKVETTIIFQRQRVVVALMVWADSEEEGRRLWSKYTDGCDKDTLLLPLSEPKLVPAEGVPDMLGNAAPEGHHYTVCAHSGAPEVYDWSMDQLTSVLGPIVELWKDEQCPLPPASHTLFVPTHRDTQVRTHGGKQLAYGFTPSLQVMTYAIYTDKAMKESYGHILEKAHAKIASNAAFFIEIPEGNVRNYSPASRFRRDALQAASEKAKILDPHGLFRGLS